jgi:hypothetical protein
VFFINTNICPPFHLEDISLSVLRKISLHQLPLWRTTSKCFRSQTLWRLEILKHFCLYILAQSFFSDWFNFEIKVVFSFYIDQSTTCSFACVWRVHRATHAHNLRKQSDVQPTIFRVMLPDNYRTLVLDNCDQRLHRSDIMLCSQWSSSPLLVIKCRLHSLTLQIEPSSNSLLSPVTFQHLPHYVSILSYSLG